MKLCRFPSIRADPAAGGLAAIALLAITVSGPALAAVTMSAASPADAEIRSAMVGLKPATDQMTMTANVDRDFMTMMMVHHDAGISMGASEVGFGARSELKKMAASDVSDQEKDNRHMREYLLSAASADKTSSSASAADTMMMDAMHKMDQSMNGMQLNGNADHDFIMMMIPHHEAAITMAQTEIKYGDDARVKKVAAGIVAGQTKDIKDMKHWYQEWYHVSYPAA